MWCSLLLGTRGSREMHTLRHVSHSIGIRVFVARKPADSMPQSRAPSMAMRAEPSMALVKLIDEAYADVGWALPSIGRSLWMS